MKTEKLILINLISLIFLILSVSFVSAGFAEWWNRIIGVQLSPCEGCEYDSRCYQIGDELVIGSSPSYCDLSRQILLQKSDGGSCNNNFECLNNYCSNGKCVDIYKEVEGKRGVIEEIGGGVKRIDAYVSIATLKDSYFVGEQVKLTDPPESVSDNMAGVYENRDGNLMILRKNPDSGEIERISRGDYNISEEISESLFPEPKFKGYIVQFEQEPVVVRKVNLEKKIEKLDKQIEEAIPVIGFIPNIIRKIQKAGAEKDIENLDEYRQELKENKAKILAKASGKIGKSITGKAVENSDENNVELMNEFSEVLNGVALDISDAEADEIRKLDGVKSVSPNLEVQTTLMNSVPLINADDVWRLDRNGNNCEASGQPCLTGEGVSIAIIDTGIDYTHADLGGCFGSDYNVAYFKFDYPLRPETFIFKLTDPAKIQEARDILAGRQTDATHVRGVIVKQPTDYNPPWSYYLEPDSISFFETAMEVCDAGIQYVEDNLDEAGGSFLPGLQWCPWGSRLLEEVQVSDCKVVGGYDFVNNDNDPIDDQGHGTHVAGIAAGNGVLKGVAPDAKLYGYKVLNSGGSGSFDDVIAGIERAVLDEVDVISMSLGADCFWRYDEDCGPDDPVSQAVDNAVDSGVVAVIAAGNSGPEEFTIETPGTARKAITVGATDKSDNIARFSSRGPVFGQNFGLVKPDIVAPGVEICSAQWDGAWDNRKCDGLIDEEHIQISGTSMATPHVAGAVALLKQKNPGWSPEEVKLAFRNTAIDIGGDRNTYGYGRVDVLRTMSLIQKPAIAKIKTNGIVKGTIDIIGTASGENFESYTLYYGFGKNPSEWHEITTSNQQVENSALYKDFDTLNLESDYYSLRLQINSANDQISKDTSLIEINNLKINKIGYRLGYISGLEKVYGEISSSYDYYKIEYKSGEEWNEICSDTRPAGEELCSIDVNSLNNGISYFFRLSANYKGNWISSQEFKAIVLKELLDGWPQEIPSLIAGPLNVGNVEENLYLIVPAGDKGLYLYNSSGNLKILDQLSDGSFTGRTPYDKYPSIYLNKELNKEYITVMNDYGAGGIYSGLIDFYGNYYKRWSEEKQKSLIVYDDILFNIDDKWGRTSGTNFIKINAFNKEGELLQNFPIEIFPDSGKIILPVVNEYESRVHFPFRIIEENGSKYIALFYKEFEEAQPKGWLPPNMKNLSIYANIYSMNGQLIKKIKVFEDNIRRFNGWSATSKIAVVDLDGDKNQEIILAFYVRDRDAQEADRYNLSAYETHTSIINFVKDTLSEPYTIQGYLIKELAIGQLEKEKPSVVLALSDTFPTTYSGQKIISFDNFGNIKFDINLPDYNDIIHGLSIGNIDSDQDSEIIVNYRPRWWGGKPSGLQIYNKNGILEKEIEIPTFGEVDYYEFNPLITDFNKDGKKEIILQSSFISKEGTYSIRLYAITMNESKSENRLDWPMFQHDPQHTGCYDCEKPQSKAVNNAEEDLTAKLIIKIQKKTGEVWNDYFIPVNEEVLIPGGKLLKLDTGKDSLGNQVFAGFNNLDVRINEAGEFRVYVALTSEEIVRDLNEELIEASYEFEVV